MSKIQRDKDEITALFNARTYTEAELHDFHRKIQRFWDAPREVNAIAFGRKIEGQAQKFRYEDLHVAFGAATKVAHGKLFKYLYSPERLAVFDNLWGQYESWRRKQDWIAEKQAQDHARMAEETSSVPF